MPLAADAGVWTPPYFDAGGGEIWMITRSVPARDLEGGRSVRGVSGRQSQQDRADQHALPAESEGESAGLGEPSAECHIPPGRGSADGRAPIRRCPCCVPFTGGPASIMRN